MPRIDQEKIKEILNRGVEEVIVKEDLEKKLLSGKKIRLYFGVDPTGSVLHLGHAVNLWKLRDFQDLGHEVILLIGDFTARIGDPSGKDTARKPLAEKEIKNNFKNYKKQASKILDFSKVKIKYNSAWLSRMKFADILKLATNFTVQQMLQRDMFDRRMKENMPISLQEFLYPLMQGYDSVVMDVDLELAGNDQTFNALAGRQLQKIYNNKDKDVLTCKLLLGTDGRKMSKTFNNFIAINDRPADMYGKIMSIKDELIDHYFELATRLSEQEILQIKSSSNNPRDVKANLAKEVVKMYYGEKYAKIAEEEFNKVFRSKELPSDIPSTLYIKVSETIPIFEELLFNLNAVSSKKEARRLIEGGGIEIINGERRERIIDWKKRINPEEGMIIKVGSRKFIKIKIK